MWHVERGGNVSKKSVPATAIKRMLHDGLATLWFGDQAVRVVAEDGQLWWVVPDITSVGGWEVDFRQVADEEIIPANWRRFHQIPTPAGFEHVYTVNEAGLYFLLGRTTLSSSAAFQEWLSTEAMISLKPLVGLGAAKHVQRANALANALGDRVRQETFRSVMGDKDPLRFARYLVTLSVDDEPIVESIPDDMRFISAESLQKNLDEGFISTRDLHRLLESCLVVIQERYDWIAQRLAEKAAGDS
jgi:hypothetical protein